jgi:hypothetical protein
MKIVGKKIILNSRVARITFDLCWKNEINSPLAMLFGSKIGTFSVES